MQVPGRGGGCTARRKTSRRRAQSRRSYATTEQQAQDPEKQGLKRASGATEKKNGGGLCEVHRERDGDGQRSCHVHCNVDERGGQEVWSEMYLPTGSNGRENRRDEVASTRRVEQDARLRPVLQMDAEAVSEVDSRADQAQVQCASGEVEDAWVEDAWDFWRVPEWHHRPAPVYDEETGTIVAPVEVVSSDSESSDEEEERRYRRRFVTEYTPKMELARTQRWDQDNIHVEEYQEKMDLDKNPNISGVTGKAKRYVGTVCRTATPQDYRRPERKPKKRRKVQIPEGGPLRHLAQSLPDGRRERELKSAWRSEETLRQI